MPTPKQFSQWYIQAWLSAEGRPEQAQLPIDALALKLIEESVEVCFAAGLESRQIALAFQKALMKGVERWTSHKRTDLPLELADVDIVLRTYRGLLGITDAAHEQQIGRKHETNQKRLWRVNEFGNLSNMGLKPQDPA